MGLFDAFFSKKEPQTKPMIPTEGLMTSQLVALFLRDGHQAYRTQYMERLKAVGVGLPEAQKLFDYELKVIREHGKAYLCEPGFTKAWFFGLKQPFFRAYPSTQQQILQEQSLTISEVSKLIDEAEWHFWNSHERELGEGVWAEIVQWRLGALGAEFAMKYFSMISREAGVSMESMMALSNEQGSHLNRYKWS